MFHGTLARKSTPKSANQHRSTRLFQTMALVATVMACSLWTAQASAGDITVIYSSDDHDRYDRRYRSHERYDSIDLIGSLLMPGSVKYHNVGRDRYDRYDRRDRYDRHHNHGRYNRPRHPHANHSHRPDFANGNRGRWQSNRHREIIYVDKDARHRGNYRDIERRSVIIRRRD